MAAMNGQNGPGQGQNKETRRGARAQKRTARGEAAAQKKARRYADFEAQCTALLAEGRTVRDRTFSIRRANGLGLLCGLAAAAAVLIGAWFLPRHHFAVTGSVIADLLLFFAAVFVSVPVHEGLHALGWAAAGGTFRGLSFGMAGGTPYCACVRPMGRGRYLLGSLAPAAVLGAGLSAAGLCLMHVPLAGLGAVNFALAGADLLVAARALFCRADLLLDHPERCGFYAFSAPAADVPCKAEEEGLPEKAGLPDQ